jgi:glycosyltransferase involved in cell wall biosynthesis
MNGSNEIAVAPRFKSSQPRVTVVTPSFKQGQFIERTILSVLGQDYPNLQYIVLDSCSTDATPRILNKYRDRISIVVEEKDNGQADAINKGFQRADGEILAYLNSDDCYAAPNIVSHAVNYLLENPEADVIYGNRYYIDVNGFFRLSYPFRRFDENIIKRACYLPQECCFWTKEIFDRAGSRVNETYHFAMDYELWLRFIKHGARFQAVDHVYGYFRWYEGQKSVDEWESRGVPEIAKLQTEYFGEAIPAKTMTNLFLQHYYGVNKAEDADGFRLYDSIWYEEVRLKLLTLQFAPLDHWVFPRPSLEEGPKNAIANSRTN